MTSHYLCFSIKSLILPPMNKWEHILIKYLTRWKNDLCKWIVDSQSTILSEQWSSTGRSLEERLMEMAIGQSTRVEVPLKGPLKLERKMGGGNSGSQPKS